MRESANLTRVFHRQLGTEYPLARMAKGAYLTDAQGRQYLDASGGAAVSCLGHGHPRVIAAIKDQLDRLAFAHTAFFSNEPAEALAAWLTERAPDGFGRVYFLSGGSEANEAALKLARQVQVERGEGARDIFVARHQSYHGNTLGALSVSGNPARRALYEPILIPRVRFAEPCYAYRHRGADESEADYGLRAARSLEQQIVSAEGRVAAFIAETVSGATMGAVPPVPGYFKEIRRICDEHGVLMILDEVMSGMGRTGALYACEQEGVVPDMITCAKGLGGGYQPIGALVVREELVEELERARGAFVHGHTYVAHATACTAGLAVQQVIEEDGLLKRVSDLGAALRARLEARFGDHPNVGDIRGRGLFQGLELVEDRPAKKPFPASARIAARLKTAAMEAGLICYPGSGTADGSSGDHVLLAPPFIIEEAQLDELVDKLAQSLGAVLDKGK